MFFVYFNIFAVLSGTKKGQFDPSGHLTCGILVSGLWLHMFFYILDSCAEIYHYESPLIKRATYVVLGFIGYHAFGVFYTVFVYHDFFETLIGYSFGIVIFSVVLLTDVFSDSLFYLMI